MPVGNDDLYTINYNYYMNNKSKWIPQLSLAAANKPGLNNVFRGDRDPETLASLNLHPIKTGINIASFCLDLFSFQSKPAI